MFGLRYDKRAWSQVKASQQRWRENPPTSGSSELVIMDITDGSVFKEHPELGKAMAGKEPSEDEPIRLAIGLYYDGVETANPLGFARGRCAFPSERSTPPTGAWSSAPKALLPPLLRAQHVTAPVCVTLTTPVLIAGTALHASTSPCSIWNREFECLSHTSSP